MSEIFTTLLGAKDRQTYINAIKRADRLEQKMCERLMKRDGLDESEAWEVVHDLRIDAEIG